MIPPSDTSVPAPAELIEIACDESGYEGEKLVGGTTTAFAHASVNFPPEVAAECVRELRRRIRSPATEHKANHLMRQKHREVLVWLLGPSGPLQGNGWVCLVDMTRYLVEKVIDLLIRDIRRPVQRGLERDALTQLQARILLDAGASAPGWASFLAHANELLRVKERSETAVTVDAFTASADVLRGQVNGEADELLAKLAAARPAAVAFREELKQGPVGFPVLDPLVPALVQTVRHWGAGGRKVAVAHDRQNTLSPDRVSLLCEVLNRADDAAQGPQRALLHRVVLVESAIDPSVQLADILAGTARWIASAEAVGEGDPTLVSLLDQYIDPASVWDANRRPRFQPT